MQENYFSVQEGFRLLLGAIAPYVCSEIKAVLRKDWWTEVLNQLSFKYTDLPLYGEDEELISSLDIAACLKLMNIEWRNVFDAVLDRQCRNYANELIAVRNHVSHIGTKDIEQPMRYEPHGLFFCFSDLLILFYGFSFRSRRYYTLPPWP